jgi:hypothetical protein
MNILEFAGEVILLSASGVLSPGPLFFTNLIYGIRQGAHAGIKIAYGHTIVELPLITILALGMSKFSSLVKRKVVCAFIDASNNNHFFKINSIINNSSFKINSYTQ